MFTRLWRRFNKRLSRSLVPDSRRTVIQTRINGYTLLVLANEDVGRAIHFGRDFESLETRYLQTAIGTDSICMDVGANIGYFTMLMAKAARLGKVYAFEPAPLSASLLRASAELNRFENIEVIESAVGASDGEVAFTQSADSAYSSIRDTERRAVERVIRIPMTSLDSFIKSRSIQSVAVLKIDVEGAEGLVLDGSHALLSDIARRPRVILMELYDGNLSPYGTCASVIVDRMRAFGYTPYFVSETAELATFRAAALQSLYNVVFLAP
jgi:FkbM family methyltransferase